MTMQTDTLRPGLLVSLKTSTRGNVSYTKKDLETEAEPTATVSKKRWETVRTIIDAKEHEAAEKARAKARSLIATVCVPSAFGLLCPEGDIPALEKATEEARQVVNAFNQTARLSRVTFYIITGRVSPDDVEALKAINSEVRELMEDMQRGLGDRDVKVVRDAATKAKAVGAMLSADYEAKVQIAVEAARAAATKIVKDGDDAAVDQSAINKIGYMRQSFLDLTDGAEVQAPVAQGHKLDLASAAE